MKDVLACLHEIALALTGTDLKPSLYRVLDILADGMGISRGAITILNPASREIRIEVSHGLSPTAVKKGRYKAGEGVTGRVIETGQPAVIPRVSREPLFLNRTGETKPDGQETSFICVPVIKGDSPVGALSVSLSYDPAYDLDQAEHLLTVVAAMVAQKAAHMEALAWEKELHREESRKLKEKLAGKYSVNNMVGSSNRMREVFQMISQVCRRTATVLIRGESGTGKELAASAIHYSSPRAEKAFIKVNCAALPVNLIESELFGHEKGAFTGAVRQKPGRFELAHKGTIFLDEIGSIGPDTQSRLLRVLQEREFERVGGEKTIRVDVRVIAATNKNLEQAVEDGTFREDLYYRLNVFPIYMPPLRERKPDILLLAEHFLSIYAKENRKEIKRFSTPAIDMLMQYHWPGNVRELENCIERAVLLCESGVIHSYHLPPTLQTGEESGTLPNRALGDAVISLEREMIIDALKNTQGNMGKAALLLSTTPRKFAYRAQKLGVSFKDYRQGG